MDSKENILNIYLLTLDIDKIPLSCNINTSILISEVSENDARKLANKKLLNGLEINLDLNIVKKYWKTYDTIINDGGTFEDYQRIKTLNYFSGIKNNNIWLNEDYVKADLLGKSFSKEPKVHNKSYILG